MKNAIDKLRAEGERLGFPHSRHVHDADRLRELRPRRGNSPWRAFYRSIGGRIILGSIGPEAEVNPRRFRAAVLTAQERLDAVEREEQARKAQQGEGDQAEGPNTKRR